MQTDIRVRVYFNLRKRLISVVALEGDKKGKVIGHASNVWLLDTKFVVQEAGRQRVIRTKHKNVHAFVQGVLTDYNATVEFSLDDWRIVRYNPYEMATFQDAQTAEPILAANQVIIQGKRIFCKEVV